MKLQKNINQSDKTDQKLLPLANPMELSFFTDDQSIHQIVSNWLDLYKKNNPKIKSLDFYKASKLILENIIYNNRNGFSISLNNNYYSEIPKRYNALKMSARKVKEVILFLEAQNLIKIYKGYFGKKKSFMTRIIPQSILLKELKQKKLHRYMLTFDKNMESIILKDYKVNKKKLLDYSENNKVVKMRNFISEYEKFLSQFKFKFKKQNIREIRFKRIFNNNSFKEGGRYYSSYQNIKSIDRSLMTIDNKKTIELDYSGLHINMLYAKENLTLPNEDVYTIKGYEAYRDIFKIALQIALNASSKRAAYSGMNDHLRKNGIDTKKIAAKQILTAFENKHENIKHYFFSGVGLELQNIDSQMVSEVLNQSLNKKIPVLPVHDSFITIEKYEKELYNMMNHASKQVLGISIKIEKKE